ncbi:MAG: hypothetical protein ACT4OK_06425 [Gemmobacter sp.]
MRVAPLVLLAACAPIPVERAERLCVDDARLATGPRGTFGVGIGSDGPSAMLDVTVSSDYLSGRDPAQVFAACVRRRSGQPPTKALYDQPAWRG